MALYNKSCFFNTLYKIRFIHIALLLKRGLLYGYYTAGPLVSILSTGS